MVDIQREFEVDKGLREHRSVFGHVVGRKLDAKTGAFGPWCVCRIRRNRRQHIRRISYVRNCSDKESYALNARLAAAEIVLRYTKPREGEPWALAYD